MSYYTQYQERNEGGQEGHNAPGAERLQYVQGSNMGAPTCFLPWRHLT